MSSTLVRTCNIHAVRIKVVAQYGSQLFVLLYLTSNRDSQLQQLWKLYGQSLVKGNMGQPGQSLASSAFRRQYVRHLGQLHWQAVHSALPTWKWLCGILQPQGGTLCLELAKNNNNKLPGKRTDTWARISIPGASWIYLRRKIPKKPRLPARYVCHSKLRSKGKCVWLGSHEDMFFQVTENILPPLTKYSHSLN